MDALQSISHFSTPFSQNPFSNLPDEIILRIFSFLGIGIQDTVKTSLVCWQWRRLLFDPHHLCHLLPSNLKAKFSTQSLLEQIKANYSMPQKIAQHHYTLHCLPNFYQETITCFTVNHGLLFTGSNTGRVLVYNTDNMQLLKMFYVGVNKAVQAISYTAQTLYIATTRSEDRLYYHLDESTNGHLHQWNWETGQEEGEPLAFDRAIQNMEANDSFLIIHTFNHLLFLKEKLSFKQLGTAQQFLLHEHFLYSICYDRDRQLYALETQNLFLETKKSILPLSFSQPQLFQLVESTLVIMTKEEILYFQLKENFPYPSASLPCNFYSIKGTPLFDKLVLTFSNKLAILDVSTRTVIQQFDLPLWIRFPFFIFPPKLKFGNQKLFLLKIPSGTEAAALFYYDFNKDISPSSQSVEKTLTVHSLFFAFRMLMTCLKLMFIALCFYVLKNTLGSKNGLIFSVYSASYILSKGDLHFIYKIIQMSLVIFKNIGFRLASKASFSHELASLLTYESNSWSFQEFQKSYFNQKRFIQAIAPQLISFKEIPICPLSRLPTIDPVKWQGKWYEFSYLCEFFLLSNQIKELEKITKDPALKKIIQDKLRNLNNPN